MSEEIKNEFISKYGKYVLWAGLAFGAQALGIYTRFVFMESEIENFKHELEEKNQAIENRLNKKIKIINQNRELIHKNECEISRLQGCK